MIIRSWNRKEGANPKYENFKNIICDEMIVI